MMSGEQASPAAGGSLRRRAERGQAPPSVVAVVSVVAIVVAMFAFFAGGSGDDAATEPQAQAGSPTPAAPSPIEEPTAASDQGKQKNDGAKKREGARGGDKGEQKRRKNRSTPRPEPDTGPPEVYVEVYNNTTISGLAASTAAQLQDGGWQVVGVDNWHGDIPASTVYYPDGMSGEANQLAQALGITRVRGAVAPMKFDRLTVILTPDAA